MIEGIMKGLFQWLYGLFLDLITYCANSLLGVMSTDLSFFEESVPIVPSLYKVFVAVGWGLLIGNCVFQCMKAMFAGMGFETDSPAILLLRTFLFGFLLIFSKSICEIGLSIGKNVIDLLGIPSEIRLNLPDESYFSGDASWLLVILIGFLLGFQLIKLFFEIAERYVLVGVLTLLCPVGLAMGGSKSTKDICAGYLRVFASMIVLMVTNVLFLKLILSALSNMPSGAMVLPWCLLVVGLAKTARKADNLLTRIGMNSASTGDPLGRGRGMMMATMAARTIISTAGRNSGGAYGKGTASSGGNARPTGGGSRTSATANHTAQTANTVSDRGSSVNSTAYTAGGSASSSNTASSSATGSQTFHASTSSRFGGGSYTTIDPSRSSGTGSGAAGSGTKVNTDRFGIQKNGAVTPVPSKTSGKGSAQGGASQIQRKALSQTTEDVFSAHQRCIP